MLVPSRRVAAVEALRLLFALFMGIAVGYYLGHLFIQYLQKPNFDVEKPEQTESVALAEQPQQEARILCWFMINSKDHKERALQIKSTWGEHCNILLFMSNETDNELPTITLNVHKGRNHLWDKLKEAFTYVYTHHYNDADWFYKADDDSCAIVKSLRYMLHSCNPEEPTYFGYKFRPPQQGHKSGGTGYVLSREALRRFVLEIMPNANKCNFNENDNEIVEIGQCLENLNITGNRVKH